MSRTCAALAASLALASVAVVAPATASAQSGDPTDGGRIASGSSGLRYPPAVQLGSIGGPELTSVGEIDLDRYAGEWFQVAAVPQPFTLQCASDTKARYGVLSPTSVSVENSCRTAWGAESGISGKAEVVDPSDPASLHVAFDGVPFQGDDSTANYRVTYLADDYSLAIVGDPARTSGFVLSRTPDLSADAWDLVERTVSDRGWWPCAFITTPQAGGRGDAVPLCPSAS